MSQKNTPWIISNTKGQMVYVMKAPQILKRKLTPGDRLGLKEVTKIILKDEPLVKAIYHIGTLKEPFTYFLYILIDDKRYALNYELNEQIENTSGLWVSLFTVIESADFAQNAAFGGSRFVNYVLRKGSEVYLSKEILVSSILNSGSTPLLSEKAEISEWWQKQIQLHMKSVAYFSKDRDYATALYYLHQAFEAALLKLLQMKTGFNTIIPNFKRLIKMTLLFTENVQLFFERLIVEDNDLCCLLWNVYPIETREKLVIAKSQLMRLEEKATVFFEIIEDSLTPS